MKRVTLPGIPRSVIWHVTSRLTPEDQNTYWRLCWHVRRYIDGMRALRITALLAIVSMVVMTLSSVPLGRMVDVGLVAMILSFATKTFLRSHRVAADRIYATDPDKWKAVGEAVKPMSDAQAPGDPVASVTFTLPDN